MCVRITLKYIKKNGGVFAGGTSGRKRRCVVEGQGVSAGQCEGILANKIFSHSELVVSPAFQIAVFQDRASVVLSTRDASGRPVFS